MTWVALVEQRANRFARLGIVLAGIVVGQALLFGPSLIGAKILLPLDILAGSGIYLPRTPEVRALPIENIYLSDLIYVAEPSRRFAVSEYQAGRVPMWSPFQFSGTVSLVPKFSPILGLQYTARSPVIIAWAQMVAAVVAGLGVYAFCRRGLGLGFWAAAVGGWCYPLTAFFIFWQGYYDAAPVCWLPWMLLAIEKTVNGSRFGGPSLAVLTGLTLLSGALDIAVQVLLGSGLYGLWRLFIAYGGRWLNSGALKGVLSLAVGWSLGCLIAAPYVVPAVEYSRTGARMARRGAGTEERPPTGLSALPQTVLPDMYGKFGVMKTGSFRISGDSQQESSAAAYAGLVATLLLAPMAWSERRRWPMAFCLAGLAFLSLAWSLDVPGVVDLLRAPGLNMLSHNRFVFLAGFSFLALACLGLEVLGKGQVEWRRWFWVPTGLVAVVCLYCLYRAVSPPEPIATQLEQVVRSGRQIGWVRDVESVRLVQESFKTTYTAGAVLGSLGLAGWLLVWTRRGSQRQLCVAVAAVLVGELLWFGYGRHVQSAPSLYFPKIPALEQVAAEGQWRVVGVKCLPASLATMCGLEDVRGYDGVDPAAYVELLRLAADPAMPTLYYALTQWLSPVTSFTPEGNVRLSPILDLLGVRYVIFRGAPPAEARPRFQSPDYWVAENTGALPRAFVPERVEVESDSAARLKKMGAPGFNPREVAYVEAALEMPSRCAGSVAVARRGSTTTELALDMKTQGLVVLTDRWDSGWRAWLNGNAVPILRVDHALRGVVVPAGKGRLEFRYEPRSFIWGVRASVVGLLLVSAWALWRYRESRRLG